MKRRTRHLALGIIPGLILVFGAAQSLAGPPAAPAAPAAPADVQKNAPSAAPSASSAPSVDAPTAPANTASAPAETPSNATNTASAPAETPPTTTSTAPAPAATNTTTPPEPVTPRKQPSLFQLQSNASVALRWPSYTVGAIVRGGGGLYGSSLGQGNPLATGYHFAERGGIVSGVVIGGIFMLLGMAAASMPDTMNTSTSSYDRVNDRGQTERVTTETRTATYSNGAGRQQAFDAAQGAIPAFAGYRQQAFEMDIYTRDWFGSKLGDARGYRLNFLLTAYSGRRLIVETGFGFGDVNAIVPGKNILVEEAYIGIPVRVLVPWGPFYAQAAIDLNGRAFELIGDDETTDYGTREVDGQIMRIDRVRPTPLTISVHVTLWRLAASIGVETVRPWAGQFGYVASLGGRF